MFSVHLLWLCLTIQNLPAESVEHVPTKGREPILILILKNREYDISHKS